MPSHVQLEGYPSIRHNAVRDIIADLLKGVAHDVALEPHLQPLPECFPLRSNSIENGARLDVAVSGLWGSRFERSFLDIRIFNPHAPSNVNHPCPPPTSIMRRKSEESMSSEYCMLSMVLSFQWF
eukprot:scpid87082/ scgid29274/ 